MDLALTKWITVAEGKRLQIRVDSTNVFNHPQPSGSLVGAGTGERIVFPLNPDVTLNNSNPFGYLGGKIGGRTFQGTLSTAFHKYGHVFRVFWPRITRIARIREPHSKTS